MPNLTISVPEKLKGEMDELPEVNWSEICRGAISRYIAQRKNPTPKIALELRSSRIKDYDYGTGYPTLSMDLKIHNRMDTEIVIDRILANARFIESEEPRQHSVGVAHDLRKKVIAPNSSGAATIHLTFPMEKIHELKDTFKSTFDCQVQCMVFVEGFKHEYNQEVKTRIPIDHWKRVVEKALKKDLS